MKHPITGDDLYEVPRTCPIPGIDITFGDAVVWKGEPWVVNSIHYYDGERRLASLIKYGENGPKIRTALAPIDELRVFSDAKIYKSHPPYRDSYA